MPKKKICSRAGCNTLVAEGVPYCDKHAKEGAPRWKFEEKRRDNPGYHEKWKGIRSTEYGAEWRKIRKMALQRDHHTCMKCGAHGNVVDHIIQHKPGDPHILENLQTLCRSCHASKIPKTRTSNKSTTPKKKAGSGGYINPPGYDYWHSDPLPPWQIERRKKEGKWPPKKW